MQRAKANIKRGLGELIRRGIHEFTNEDIKDLGVELGEIEDTPQARAQYAASMTKFFDPKAGRPELVEKVGHARRRFTDEALAHPPTFWDGRSYSYTPRLASQDLLAPSFDDYLEAKRDRPEVSVEGFVAPLIEGVRRTVTRVEPVRNPKFRAYMLGEQQKRRGYNVCEGCGSIVSPDHLFLLETHHCFPVRHADGAALTYEHGAVFCQFGCHSLADDLQRYFEIRYGRQRLPKRFVISAVKRRRASKAWVFSPLT